MIRDEFSKVVGVRIPPNGYRKYVKELSRTGAFGGLQYENSLLILLEAVEALQEEVEKLKTQPSSSTMTATVGEPPIRTTYPPLDPPVCDVCGKEFKNALGLLGHKRSHARSVPKTTSKQDDKVRIQSK